MKISPRELYERLTEEDADDIVEEVLAMSPSEVRNALRDLGYHLPTLHANIRRRAGLPPTSTRGFIKGGVALTGASGIGALIWTAITTAAPVLAPIAAQPAPENDTLPALTAAAAPELPTAPETDDAGTDGGDDR
jgi:hypothetical protein